MPKFNRERAKAELGWTDQQIDAYLASDQAKADSVSVQPGAPGGGDPLGMIGGMASGAVDAIGGGKALGIGAGAGLTYLGKRWLDGRKSAKAPTATPKSTNPADARISEARAMKMEADARAATARADLAERKLAPPEAAPKPQNMSRTQPASAPAKPAEPPKRTTKPKAAKPRRTQKPPEPIPIRTTEERAPITVDGKPATRGAKQRGVSKREIASRQAGMAAARGSAPLPETDDIMEQLARSLHVEQGMTARGVPRTGGLRGQVRSGLRGAGGMAAKTAGPLGLLLMLLDAGAIPGQMDEADQFGQDQFLPPELLEQARRQPRARGL